MQADAEHQENHSQFSQLADGFNVPDKSGREGADGDPRQHISNDGWQSYPPGYHSPEECDDESDGYIDEQRQFVHMISAETEASAARKHSKMGMLIFFINPQKAIAYFLTWENNNTISREPISVNPASIDSRPRLKICIATLHIDFRRYRHYIYAPPLVGALHKGFSVEALSNRLLANSISRVNQIRSEICPINCL